MTTKIQVSVNGKQKFIWDGDTSEHLAMFREWTLNLRNAGKEPIQFANQCIMQLGTGFDNADEDRQRQMVSLVIWRILISDADPEFGVDLMTGRRRTIGECLPFFDYDIDFSHQA